MYTQDAVTLRVKPSTRTVTARLAKLNIPKSGLVDADVHVTFPMLAEYAPDEPLYFPIAKDRGGGTGLARATVSGPDLLIVANSVNSTGDFYGAATWGY